MLVSSLPAAGRRAIVRDRGGCPYPVFGLRISTHYLVRQEAEEILPHLFASYSDLKKPWETLWGFIARDFCHEFWVVDLP